MEARLPRDGTSGRLIERRRAGSRSHSSPFRREQSLLASEVASGTCHGPPHGESLPGWLYLHRHRLSISSISDGLPFGSSSLLSALTALAPLAVRRLEDRVALAHWSSFPHFNSNDSGKSSVSGARHAGRRATRGSHHRLQPESPASAMCPSAAWSRGKSPSAP